MKTPTTTATKAPAIITPRNIKTANRNKAATLAARLQHITAAELLEMILAAGLDAVAAAIDSQGSLALPLEFSIEKGNTRPIHLPAAMAGKLRTMAAAAGIEGGADSFAAEVIGSALDSTAADLFIDGWNITNPATIAELYRIQSATAKEQTPT